MWKGSIAVLAWLVVLSSSALAGSVFGTPAYVHKYKGEYLFSNPTNRSRPEDKLAPGEGKALLERLLSPAHMVVTGFGGADNATLRAGDDAKETLFALLGSAKRLPSWRRCEYAVGYVSARVGDSTVVLVDMSDPCLDNPEYVSGFLICSSPSALPSEYRQHLELFSPSPSVHAGLATQSGLRLGITAAEVEEVMGKPLWREKNMFHYAALGDVLFSSEFLIARWHWPKDVESKRGGDEHVVKVWFSGGRVSGFLVRKLYDL